MPNELEDAVSEWKQIDKDNAHIVNTEWDGLGTWLGCLALFGLVVLLSPMGGAGAVTGWCVGGFILWKLARYGPDGYCSYCKKPVVNLKQKKCLKCKCEFKDQYLKYEED